MEAPVSKELATRALFADALAGRIDRRTLLARAAALGVSAPVAAALAQETMRSALAKEEGTLEITYYDWILGFHPAVEDVNADFTAEFPLTAEVAPTQNFGIERFLAEASEQTSTWDMYIGVTPFLEMIQMVESDVIEPWDPYLPEGLLDSMIAPIREEGSYDDSFYVWPFLLDVIVQGWHSGVVEAAAPRHLGALSTITPGARCFRSRTRSVPTSTNPRPGSSCGTAIRPWKRWN
jgi:hypothetical protein